VLYYLLKLILNVLLKIFFWCRVYGRRNFPPGPALVACNHQSYLDPPVVGQAAPGKIAYIARRSLAKTDFLQRFYTNVNCILITVDEPEVGVLKKVLLRLSRGEKVLIFPEGQRTFDGELQPPRRGIGFLVAKARVPVIPAYVHGTYRALPRGRSLIRPAKIIVAFGRPIRFDHLIGRLEKKQLYRNITETVMARIADLKQFCLSKL